MPSEREDSKVTCNFCNGLFHSRGFNQHHRACEAKQAEKVQQRSFQTKLSAAARLRIVESRNAPRIEGEAHFLYGPSDLKPLSAPKMKRATPAQSTKMTQASRDLQEENEPEETVLIDTPRELHFL